jgi:hypothetical protein
MAEALAMVDEKDERFFEAELNRVRAELLLGQGEDVEAEASQVEPRPPTSRPVRQVCVMLPAPVIGTAYRAALVAMTTL